MSLVPWEPVRELASVRDAMNRIFDDAFSRFPSLVPRREDGWWQPSVDVIDRDKEIVVKANVPGIDPKDVEVTVAENAINIKGQVAQEKEDQGNNYYRRERYYGAFQRSIPLDSKVVAEQAKATFKNGVLEVTVPKVEGAGGKQVQVKVE
ncbi:MAG: Hsp20/alpha crystallin family protein [Clostridia bacterium]|nr:MAG: Hsp20/alpha crystallin family protein [Clostridia bacterium]